MGQLLCQQWHDNPWVALQDTGDWTRLKGSLLRTLSTDRPADWGEWVAIMPDAVFPPGQVELFIFGTASTAGRRQLVAIESMVDLVDLVALSVISDAGLYGSRTGRAGCLVVSHWGCGGLV